MLAALALAFVPAFPPGDEVELVNPSFESRPTADEPVPGWTIELGAQNGATTPESVVALDEKEKKDGRRSLHLSGDAATRGWMILKQDVPVRPGGRYHLRAQVKTEGVRPNGFGLDNCYIGLIFFDADGKVAGRQFTFPNLPDQKWRGLDARATAGPSARRGHVYLFLSMIGDLWIDELTLEVSGGEELARPERILFEDFAKARRVPSKWSREVGATNGEGDEESAVEVDRDQGALKLSGGADTKKWWMVGPRFKAAPGELYTFSARVKARDVRREGNQFSNLHLSLLFLDKKKEPIGRARFCSVGEGTFDWKPASVEGVSPEGTRTVLARVFLSMSGEAWFDDLEVQRLEDVPMPYDHWETIEAQHVVLRYSGDHPQARSMRAYAERLDAAKLEICRQLEVEFDEPIAVFVYKDVEEGELLTGGTLDFADPKGRQVHQRFNSYIAHEMVHVIAHTTLENAGTGLLGEGIAVWLNGQSPASHHQRAAALLAQGELPSMADLLARFRDQAQAYPAAGSFCGHLLAEHGLDVFKELYPLGSPSARAKELVGASFEDMEAGWHAMLQQARQ